MEIHPDIACFFLPFLRFWTLKLFFALLVHFLTKKIVCWDCFKLKIFKVMAFTIPEQNPPHQAKIDQFYQFISSKFIHLFSLFQDINFQREMHFFVSISVFLALQCTLGEIVTRIWSQEFLDKSTFTNVQMIPGETLRV